MLRLERRNYHKEILVNLRRKNPLLNKTLLYAFALALVLHLMAFFLFKLHSIIVSTKILPNTIVEAIPMHPVETNLALPRPSTNYLNPPFSTPSWKNQVVANELKPQTSFAEMHEEKMLESLYFTKENSNPPSLHVEVFGELSKRSLTAYNFSIPDDKFYMRYSVQVDDQTGKIFWYQLLEGDSKGQKFAENLLQQLNFESIQGSFVTKGEIEIK